MKLSIRYKFIIGFMVIFCIGITTASFFMKRTILQNNERIIKNEMLTFQRDLTVYLRQYLKLKQIQSKEEYFNKNAGDMASMLASKIDDRVIIYSNDGKLLVDSAFENGEILIYEDIGDKYKNATNYNKDFQFALNGKSAYTIIPIENKHLVIFSCPIIIDNIKLGIMRCSRDYSELFNSSMHLFRMMNISIISVLGFIFLFSILLFTKITVPVIKLSNVSKKVAEGDFDVCVNVKSRDEIGELAHNFEHMNNKIKNQIETIKKDRDNLKKIEKHRKSFFDNVTHELKTPLTIISGYSQILMQKDFDDKEFLMKAAEKIKNESDRMHDMVVDLLEISKFESEVSKSEVEKVNISEIVLFVCDDMSIKADKYEMIIHKNIEKEVSVTGSIDELRRMMINLIDNSIKYGNIKSTINVSITKENNYGNIIVEDRGKGIPEEKLSKIFEPFYRVDKSSSREKGSNGLGLYIVNNIVKKHNGIIEITSKENVGTIVNIKIPLQGI